MKAWANIVDWLSRKKTKNNLAASMSLIGGALTGELPWSQVLLGVAGVWTVGTAAQSIADIGKEKAKVVAQATEGKRAAERAAALEGLAAKVAA